MLGRLCTSQLFNINFLNSVKIKYRISFHFQIFHLLVNSPSTSYLKQNWKIFYNLCYCLFLYKKMNNGYNFYFYHCPLFSPTNYLKSTINNYCKKIQNHCQIKMIHSLPKEKETYTINNKISINIEVFFFSSNIFYCCATSIISEGTEGL